uniref:DNA topoisomerase (ATP-hydrolyzing) n=1 Tax=Elaeophora elaphi TaxID=1147741 RepID=A0A0R3S535_9BILA
MSSLIAGENSDDTNTDDSVARHIEECCLAFLKSLVENRKNPNGHVILSNPRFCFNSFVFGNAVDNKGYKMKLTPKNSRIVAQMVRTVSMIHELRVLKIYKTKRDLFYERKSLFGVQRNLNNSINRVCYWLGMDPTPGYVRSSGHGLVIGQLKIYESTGIVDCSVKATLIDEFFGARLSTTAQCILVVEKDATFQRLIGEGFLKLFPNVLLVTGKGYPDVATRMMLKKLSNLPLFGLLDCDPHGIEIAMTYKYGTSSKKFGMENLKLPHFEWIGLSRHLLPKFVIPTSQFLPLQKRELVKVEKLCQRTASLGDKALLDELIRMRQCGNKLELEAVSGIAPGSMCRYLLRTKLSKYAVE